MRTYPQRPTLGCVAALALALTAGCATTAFVWVDPTTQTRVEALNDLPADAVTPPAWFGPTPDRVLLRAQTIAELNQRNGARPGAGRDVLAAGFGAQSRVTDELEERIAWLQARVDDGRYRSDVPAAFDVAVAGMRSSAPRDEARVVVAARDVRCVPMGAGLYTLPADPDFDRNQCSRLHPGEVVRVLRHTTDGRWWYVSTTHGVGWTAAKGYTPPLPIDQVRTFQRQHPRLVILADGARAASGLRLRMGTHLPMIGRDDEGRPQVLAPTPEGLRPTTVLDAGDTHEGFLPFTRRHALTLALSQLGAPYGWGGRGGHRDCSRLLLDLFSAFGITLGRHSRAQAASGRRTVHVGELDPVKKRGALREAMGQGLVLAYMPGHILLLLGEDGGRVFALSAISEFLVPGEDGDRMMRLDRVTVSDLQVGEGTERRSFLDRMTTLAVFGAP